MGEVIVITSGKGGVGKTTITANLGIALSKLGKSVIAIDTDIGLRNLDVVMGLENQIVYNLVDVLEGTCRLRQAVIKDRRYNNLYLLPSAQSKDKDSVTPQQMIDLTSCLKEEFDYVLIDSPAGIEQGFENSVVGADKAIVVVNPEITSVRDADRVIGKLDAKGLEDHAVIVNRLNYEMTKRGDMLDVSDIIETLSVKLLGVVPDDRSITVSTNKGEPIVLDDKAQSGQAFRNIAKRITGEEVPLLKLGSESTGIFSAIKRMFKKN